MERNHYLKRQKKQKLRAPLDPEFRPPPGVPELPRYMRPKETGGKTKKRVNKKLEDRRARAKKPESPLADRSKDRKPTDAESETSSPSTSSEALASTSSGASASTSTSAVTKKQLLAKKTATKVEASLAKYGRRRQLLQSGSTGLPDDMKKLSLVSFDELLDNDIDDLYRDSDDDLTDDEYTADDEDDDDVYSISFTFILLNET